MPTQDCMKWSPPVWNIFSNTHLVSSISCLFVLIIFRSLPLFGITFKTQYKYKHLHLFQKSVSGLAEPIKVTIPRDPHMAAPSYITMDPMIPKWNNIVCVQENKIIQYSLQDSLNIDTSKMIRTCRKAFYKSKFTSLLFWINWTVRDYILLSGVSGHLHLGKQPTTNVCRDLWHQNFLSIC